MTLNRTSNWSESLELNIDKWIKERWEQFPNYIPMFCNVQNTTLGLVRQQASAGIGLVPQVSEGAETPDASFIKAYATIYIPKSYRLNVPVTWEEYEDDQNQVFNDRAGELADAAMRTANIYAASMIMNSQSTSYLSYGDGKPLDKQAVLKSSLIDLETQNWATGAKEFFSTLNDLTRRLLKMEMRKSELCV